MPPRVSLILPTYNESGNIMPLIEQSHQYLSPWEHEIIVVDDNSPDGTYDLVRRSGLPFVRAILREKDPSLARAIRCGLENARGEILVVMDSDFNHRPEDLSFMVSALDHYDLVIGSRFVYGGSMTSMTRYRLSWLFNIFVRFTTGGSITDSLSGVFAVKREILKHLDYDKIFFGYGEYYIRFLYFLQKQKIRIVQFPSAYGARLAGKGNSAFGKIFVKYSIATIRLAWQQRVLRHFFKK
ncbi:MAG: glycosyltransferase [Candidatus Omnitrophica bacterium]|nr:glycosyltransferase [Candidatus Omnitrophota bacterium]